MNTFPFYLGNLRDLKIGDEVTTLDENGKVASRVLVVHSLPEWGVRVCRPGDTTARGYWKHENGGGAPYAMHDQSVMRFYYSANPEHIAKAKANARAEKESAEAKKRAFQDVFDLARPVGEALGDGWEEGESFGEGYQRTSAAHALAEKLTPEQIRTLAGWLGVGPLDPAEPGQASGESVNLAHLAELRRQNAALLEQVAELSALARDIPWKLAAARLDAREGKPTQYDYARAEKALRVRV
jgi:hypothetical protein